jgi:hypothetical protein
MPIADFNNVQVFLVDRQPADWVPTHPYQRWAYLDFIYSGDQERRYFGSNRSTPPGFYKIPRDELRSSDGQAIDIFTAPVRFTMSLNRNGSLYYQRDDAGRTRVRISDDACFRRGYKLTYDHEARVHAASLPHLLSPFGHQQPAVRPPLPHGVVIMVATNDDFQCIICNTNEQNIKFKPCGHTSTCSQCYPQTDPMRTEPRCPMCRTVISSIEVYTPPRQSHEQAVPVDRTVWFDRIFGFNEMGLVGMPVVRKFLHVEDDSNGRKFLVGNIDGSQKRLNAGIPLCLSVGKLLESVSPLTQSAGVRRLAYYNMFGDIKNFHMDTRLAGSLFQVASQFNALEMVDASVIPEEGITKYEHDRTQGPICAMVCPYGTVYRNYFSMMPGETPQTKDNQLNTLSKLTSPPFNFKLINQNGYVYPESRSEARRIEQLLKNRDNFLNAMKLVEYFIQDDTTVVNSDGGSAAELHSVSQIYCSALPLAYFHEQLVDCPMFLNMILHAVYFSTLARASHMARVRKNRVKVFLTRVGGGVFGNPDTMIDAAIKSATNYFSSEPIDVIMVNYRPNTPFTELSPLLSIDPQTFSTGNEFILMLTPPPSSMPPGGVASQYSQSYPPSPPFPTTWPPPPQGHQQMYPPPPPQGHQQMYPPPPPPPQGHQQMYPPPPPPQGHQQMYPPPPPPRGYQGIYEALPPQGHQQMYPPPPPQDHQHMYPPPPRGYQGIYEALPPPGPPPRGYQGDYQGDFSKQFKPQILPSQDHRQMYPPPPRAQVTTQIIWEYESFDRTKYETFEPQVLLTLNTMYRNNPNQNFEIVTNLEGRPVPWIINFTNMTMTNPFTGFSCKIRIRPF